MIIIKISGGLGNQLFQYATARSIALRLNHDLYIDNSWYKNIHEFEDQSHENATTIRDYLLNNFNIKSDLISNSTLNWMKRVNIYSKKYKTFNFFRNKFLNNFTFSTYTTKNFSIAKLKTNKKIYLSGYWQNNDIIDNYRTVLLEELQLKNDISSDSKIYLNKINKTDSVAIHFRRGDYISKPNSNRLHASCSNQYYHNAIDHITDSINNPDFYIFSDEIEWVKNNVELPTNVTFIDNSTPPYEHLHLMSQCKHQIIANSTFSWWSAWLNTYKDKIIISPKYWYYDKKLNDSIIRIPSSWIKINNLKS